MSEKGAKKISVSTILLVIAIIIIGVMGYFIYKLYNEKDVETARANELQEQVNNLNGTINDLQGKINIINDTLNNNTNNTNANTNTNTNVSVELKDEDVKKAISDYLELYASANCGTPLDVLKEKGKINYDPSKYDINTNTGEIITNLKFSDYKNAMLNFVSEAEFERNWTSKINLKENSNGYLTYLQGGGGLRVYTIKSVSKINDTTFSAKTSSVVDNNEFYEEKEYTFTVKTNNGVCVIDSFN